MKFRTIIAAACVAIAACTPSHTQTPHTSTAASLEAKTVALVGTRHGEARAFCTGVWVGEQEILTAAHCVADLVLDGDRVPYITRDDLLAARGDELEAVRFGDVRALDLDHDLALVGARLPPAHAVANVVAVDENPVVGEVTLTMGHPLGLWWSYSAGQVAAVRTFGADLGNGLDPGTWYVQTTAPVSPGNSGGGLFDAEGQLLGICHGSLVRGQGLNLYVHAMHVRAFLKGAHDGTLEARR